LNFYSSYFFSSSLNHADFFGVFNAQPVTLHPFSFFVLRRIDQDARPSGDLNQFLFPQESGEESEGNFVRGGSDPPSKRLPFDILFFLTEKVTLSYTIHKKVLPLLHT
jgi:hypothetical protein